MNLPAAVLFTVGTAVGSTTEASQLENMIPWSQTMWYTKAVSSI